MSNTAFRLRPSAAAAMVQCPGSVRMRAMFPEQGDGQAAREGRAAHWALSQMLTDQPVAEGQITPEGTVLTREMLESAEECFDDVVATLGADWRRFVRVESPVSLNRIYPGMWGTPDIRAFVPSYTTPNVGHRYVWDFKHGHRVVHAFENWQILAYHSNDEDSARSTTDILHCRIVQPRNPAQGGPVRTWTITKTEHERYRAVLTQAAADAMGENPPLRTGPACEDCEARHVCPALQKAAYSAAEHADAANPLEMSPAALGLEYRMLTRALQRLKARVSGLEAQAEALHLSGTPVPFTRMERGRGATVWTVDASTVIESGRLMGLDVSQPVTPITPKQAEKAGYPASLLGEYSKFVPGVFKLIVDDDTKARQVFGFNKPTA